MLGGHPNRAAAGLCYALTQSHNITCPPPCHNTTCSYALSPEKQAAVASETRRVWCSLAERLGMFALKVGAFCVALLLSCTYAVLSRECDPCWDAWRSASEHLCFASRLCANAPLPDLL